MDNLNNAAGTPRDYEDELTLRVKDALNISAGCYSRKVFVGGLPPNIDDDEIFQSFKLYGSVRVDWPYRSKNNERCPPKGYAFLLFEDEVSVHKLLKACKYDGEKYFTFVSYPKASARVAFKSHKTYIEAISSRLVQLNDGKINKTVEVKPYMLDNQACDICLGKYCNDKFPQFFCANITCLKYYCDQCWKFVHTADNKQFHRPMVKEISEKNKMPILQQ